MSATDPFPERLYRWATPVELPQSEQLANQLAVHGLRLNDIRWCLISHFHADHIAGLRDLAQARFMCMQADFEETRQGSRLALLSRGLLPALIPHDFESRVTYAEHTPRSVLPSGWSDFGVGHDLFGDGSLMALALHGHAPRQMGLVFRDEKDRQVLLCADACWSRQSWQALQMPMGITRMVMHDWPQYQQTLARLHRLGSQHPELVILPSHCQQSLSDYTGVVA
jgi:glyoxylase-like metal-dependent hydrolase (beta-lactamase superfamily II)